MRDLIVSTISSRVEEMIDFASRLIAVPTENPPGQRYHACVEVISKELRRIGLGSEVLDVPSKGVREPLPYVRSFCGTGKHTLYFHGHYDVVPASVDGQFVPRRERDNLFGRGSADMKGGLAAMIYAAWAIQETRVALDGRLGLTIVPDEETGGARGAGRLAEAGALGVDGIGMLTPEPSSGAVWNANREALSLKITVRGKSAHVGLHFEGTNASKA